VRTFSIANPGFTGAPCAFEEGELDLDPLNAGECDEYYFPFYEEAHGGCPHDCKTARDTARFPNGTMCCRSNSFEIQTWGPLYVKQEADPGGKPCNFVPDQDYFWYYGCDPEPTDLLHVAPCPGNL